MAINFAGYVFKDDGSVVNGADVYLKQVSDGVTEASTTTNSSGYWSFGEADQDRYYIEIVSGSSKRFIRWADEISLKEIDVRNNDAATTPAATFTNLTDAVANQVAVFSGANSTRADDDEIYMSFKLADSGGNIDEFARMTVVATDVTAGSEDGQIEFDVMKAGTLTKVWTITSSDAAAMSFDMNVDALTIGSGADTAISLTFDANTSDGVITWMEDEDYFKFSDEIFMNSTEKILFGDTATFIHQSSDGVMTVDGEATIDLNASTAVLVSNDLKLNSDSAVLNMGAGDDFTITHDGTTGATIAGNPVTITAAGASTWSTSSGALTVTSAAALNLNPASGSAILLDGTISIDAGVVTGATSITSTAFVGDITGDVTGNTSGTALTVTQAAQTAITSLGTLTALTVDDVAVNGKVITMTGDTDDTATLTAAAGGALTIATTDTAAAAGHITLDADGSVILDPNANDIQLKNGGTQFGKLYTAGGGQLLIEGTVSDQDIVFKGNDGGSASTTLMYLDVSEAGAATFSGGIADAGTIAAGTWNGTAIASAYLDSDTAHLSGTQTFTGAKTFADLIVGDGSGFLLGYGSQVAVQAVSGIQWQMHGTGNDDSRMVLGRWSANGNGPRLQMIKSRDGTIGDNTIATSGDGLGQIDWTADDGTDMASVSASIQAYCEGTMAANKTPGRLVFATSPTDSQAVTERMRINSSGYVSIGAIDADQLFHLSAGNPYIFVESTEASNSAGYRGGEISFIGREYAANNRAAMASIRVEHDGAAADHSGRFEFWITDGDGSDSLIGSNQGGTAALIIDSDHNATLDGTLSHDSDIALKTNINTIDSALNKVNQMRGVSYDRVDKDYSGVGLVAQELEKIAPELVQKNHEYKSIAYSQMAAYFVEAIKELSNKVKELEAK